MAFWIGTLSVVLQLVGLSQTVILFKYFKQWLVAYDILSIEYYVSIQLSSCLIVSNIGIIFNNENHYVGWFQHEGNSMKMKNCKIMIIDVK